MGLVVGLFVGDFEGLTVGLLVGLSVGEIVGASMQPFPPAQIQFPPALLQSLALK